MLKLFKENEVYRWYECTSLNLRKYMIFSLFLSVRNKNFILLLLFLQKIFDIRSISNFFYFFGCIYSSHLLRWMLLLLLLLLLSSALWLFLLLYIVIINILIFTFLIIQTNNIFISSSQLFSSLSSLWYRLYNIPLIHLLTVMLVC